MNDSLFLPHAQAAHGTRRLAGWECRWLPLGEGEAEGLPHGHGDGWTPVEVPAQLSARTDRSAVWYRARFAKPEHQGRSILRFGGAFLAANVWLNGRLLGSHYGYFAPFGFDATPHLRADNLLVVCCESPVETDVASRHHVMGWFNEGDSRPAPTSSGIVDPARYEVPLGLWRPVEVEHVDNVVVDSVRVRAWPEADVGRVEVEVALRNLDGREMAGEVAVSVAPAAGGVPVRLRRAYRVAGGVELPVSMSLSIPGAARWQPWRLGGAVLYSATVEVGVAGRPSARVEERFGFRDLSARSGRDGWEIEVNGRPFFLRGVNYMPAYRLDQLTPERFAADLAEARAANLDAVRVHAHVLPGEFHEQADAAGMLVLADLPLTGGYAYHAGGEEARFFERAARSQAAEAAILLRNRPSLLGWFAHDGPPWTPAGADLGEVHTARQNYTADQELRALLEELDPGRLALAASGELDVHAWLGWSAGRWSELDGLEPGLVTEFGAQAMPAPGSDAWDAVGRRWPVAADDPEWLHLGFQPWAWAEHGIGLPEEFEELEEFAQESLEYQAFLVSWIGQQLRRRKFARCWGSFAYHLVDPIPGIGFGLLDGARVRRPAFESLAHAMEPVHLFAEPTGYVPLVPAGFGFPVGTPVGVRLSIVNDDPGLTGTGRVRWWVGRERGPETAGLERIRDAVRRKSFSGEVSLPLPTAWEPAVQATSLNLPIDAEGDYRLEAELSAGGRVVSASRLDFTVGARLISTRQPAPVPPRLAARVITPDSLRFEDGVARFELHNRARPAVVTRLDEVRLDGLLLPGARVLVESQGTRVALPRRFDLPYGRAVQMAVEADRALTEGRELEAVIEVPGVIAGMVKFAMRA